MKKALISGLVSMASLSAFAQGLKEESVPSAVKQSFKKMYPTAVVEKWGQEEGNYEAEFKVGKEEKEAVFTKEGKLVKTELALASLQNLPAPVLTAFNKTPYAAYEFEGAEKIETADGKVTYEVEVEKGDMVYELFYDGKGTLVDKKEKKESSEEKKD
jgi:hypothetical protein